MGPKQSRISRKDVRLGLRYAWHEEPDKAIINGYMILALGTLTLFSPDAVFLALTLTFLAPFVFSLGYQVYRGLAAARDGRDFGDYLDQQYTGSLHDTDILGILDEERERRTNDPE